MDILRPSGFLVEPKKGEIQENGSPNDARNSPP